MSQFLRYINFANLWDDWLRMGNYFTEAAGKQASSYILYVWDISPLSMSMTM